MRRITPPIALLALLLAACGNPAPAPVRLAGQAPAGRLGTDPTFRGPLTPHGGPVQTDPQVVLVYWGPVWQSGGFQLRVRADEQAMLARLPGSDWGAVLGQYGVHNDIRLAQTWVDAQPPPPRTLGYKAMLAEAERASRQTGIAPGLNVQWMLFPPPSSDLRNFKDECGEHDSNQSAGTFVYALVMPFDTRRFGSGPSSCVQYDAYGHDKAQATVVLSTHEIYEAATDPLERRGNGTGWWSQTAAKRFGMGASEGGDGCYGQAVEPWGPSGPAVQEIWSNLNQGPLEQNGCVDSLSGGRPRWVGQTQAAPRALGAFDVPLTQPRLPAANPRARARLQGS